MSAVVEARSVVKLFGARAAVAGIDLDVMAGSCFGLLGPTGAGKTTTLRMIYGVTRPTGGSIRVFGLDITERRREVRARLGVTLRENVMTAEISPVLHRHVGVRAQREEVDPLLDTPRQFGSRSRW